MFSNYCSINLSFWHLIYTVDIIGRSHILSIWVTWAYYWENIKGHYKYTLSGDRKKATEYIKHQCTNTDCTLDYKKTLGYNCTERNAILSHTAGYTIELRKFKVHVFIRTVLHLTHYTTKWTVCLYHAHYIVPCTQTCEKWRLQQLYSSYSLVEMTMS